MMIKTEVWINCEGTLPIKSLQFGSWLCTKPFSATQKNVIKVPGFYAGQKKECSLSKPSNDSGQPPHMVPAMVVSKIDSDQQSLARDKHGKFFKLLLDIRGNS